MAAPATRMAACANELLKRDTDGYFGCVEADAAAEGDAPAAPSTASGTLTRRIRRAMHRAVDCAADAAAWMRSHDVARMLVRYALAPFLSGMFAALTSRVRMAIRDRGRLSGLAMLAKDSLAATGLWAVLHVAALPFVQGVLFALGFHVCRARVLAHVHLS